jgi:hypothetical protein
MIDRLVFDLDYMKHSIAAVCETRSVIVTHKKSGDMKEFLNRTEFWGSAPKYQGGWLGALNKERLAADKGPLLPEHFLIEDKQELHMSTSKMHDIVDEHIQGVCATLGTSKYHGYIGKGASWRVEASTLIEYKGNRKGALKPLMMDDIEKHLKRKHNAKEVTELEADDWAVIDTVGKANRALVGVDKDYNGVDGIVLFNPDTMEKPLQIAGLGKLWIDEKNKVRGMGRKWFYLQVLSGDSADNYCANSACDTKWGDKSAFKLLAPCNTDAECWDAMIVGYKKLYPEMKTFTGWRGDELMIDARYVLKENCTLAWMLRTKDAPKEFDLDAELEKYGAEI